MIVLRVEGLTIKDDIGTYDRTNGTASYEVEFGDGEVIKLPSYPVFDVGGIGIDLKLEVAESLVSGKAFDPSKKYTITITQE